MSTHKNLIWETTSTAGTGAFTLLGAQPGYYSYSTFGNGATVYYFRSDSAGNFEEAFGTVAVGGSNTITRIGSPINSSNAGAAVNWLAGGTQNVRDTPGAGIFLDIYNFGSEWSSNASSVRANLNVATLGLEGQTGSGLSNDKVVRLSGSGTWSLAANTDSIANLGTLAIWKNGKPYPPGRLVPISGTANTDRWLGTSGNMLTAPVFSVVGGVVSLAAGVVHLYLGRFVDNSNFLFLPSVPVVGS